jgi:hypothetical protein
MISSNESAIDVIDEDDSMRHCNPVDSTKREKAVAASGI